jgi:ABC-type nitrate/sulfonate/bicarbonate transport system permease component
MPEVLNGAKPLSGRSAFALGLAGVLLLIVLPWLVAESTGVREVILPKLRSVFKTGHELLASNELVKATLVSLVRVNLGFALAVVSAVPLGIVLARYRRLFTAAEPVIESFRFVVAFAWIPLAILWFGTHEAGKIFIIWYAGFFVMLLPTIAAVRGVNPDLVKAARTLGADELLVFRKVVLPAITPELIVAMRIAFGICWVSILAAELVASRAGLGYMLADAREMLRTDVVVVAMVMIGVIGAAYNGLFGLLARRTAHW